MGVLPKGVLIDLRVRNFVHAKTSLHARCVHFRHCVCNLSSPGNEANHINRLGLCHFISWLNEFYDWISLISLIGIFWLIAWVIGWMDYFMFHPNVSNASHWLIDWLKETQFVQKVTFEPLMDFKQNHYWS